MNGIRGFVFDCDGVLFESKKANLAYYNKVLAYFDEPFVTEDDHEKLHLCHTAASPCVFSVLLGNERAEKALQIAAGLDYREFIPFMEPEPGVREALIALAKHFPLAVATNRGNSMSSILDYFDLGEYFQVVVTSRDVVNPKPAPDMLLEAAKQLNHAAQDLLFVGDSELDQLAARAAKMPFANYRGNLQADMNLVNHQSLVSLFLPD